MLITDIELVMMALAAVLTTLHFPRKANNWEGLPVSSCMWAAWKTAFRLMHLKRQCQLLALGESEPLGKAHGVFPAAGPAIGQLKKALDNLALAATNGTAVRQQQQLTTANLTLTATVAMLTAINKKLVDAAAAAPHLKMASAGTQLGMRPAKEPLLGNYCWMHSHCCSKNHTSETCKYKATGHHNTTTASNTLGGTKRDKGWNTACT